LFYCGLKEFWNLNGFQKFEFFFINFFDNILKNLKILKVIRIISSAEMKNNRCVQKNIVNLMFDAFMSCDTFNFFPFTFFFSPQFRALLCLMCEGNIDEWEQNYETPLRWSYSMWKIIKAKATINIFVWCVCFITLILFHIHVTQRHLKKHTWWIVTAYITFSYGVIHKFLVPALFFFSFECPNVIHLKL
jgi:hypothetical protein